MPHRTKRACVQDIFLPRWRAHASGYKRDCLRGAEADIKDKRDLQQNPSSKFLPHRRNWLEALIPRTKQSRYLKDVWDARDDVTSAQRVSCDKIVTPNCNSTLASPPHTHPRKGRGTQRIQIPVRATHLLANPVKAYPWSISGGQDGGRRRQK